MTLDEQAEHLAIQLEQSYAEGGLPKMIGVMLVVLKAMRGGEK